MAYKWNASTVTIGGAPSTPLLSARVTYNGQEIEITGSADAVKYRECGLADTEATFEIAGVGTTAAGSAATIIVTLAGSQGAVTLTNAVCTSRAINGTLDGAIQTTYTFVPGQEP